MSNEECMVKPFVYFWIFCNTAYLFDFGCVQSVSTRIIMVRICEGCQMEYLDALCKLQASANRAYKTYMGEEL